MKLIIKNIPKLILLSMMTVLSVATATAGTEVSKRIYDTTSIGIGSITGGDGNVYSTIDWPGLKQSGEVGSPTLPVEYIRFIVPVYTKNFRVSVNNITRGASRILANELYPVQMDVPSTSDSSVPFAPPSPEAYSVSYPIHAEVVEEGFIDGCNHVVTVAVYPIYYSPAAGSISASRSLNVTLQYDECTPSELKDTPIIPPFRSSQIDLSFLVVNTERISSTNYVPAQFPSSTSFSKGSYYIISPENIADAFEDLVVWKRQKGYDVQLHTIESIYDKYKPSSSHKCELHTSDVQMPDSAASLRTFLQDEFAKNGAFYCLLAGDWRTSMPIRYVYTDSKSLNEITSSSTDKDIYYHNIHGTKFIPTDNYFSDLTTSIPLENIPQTDFNSYYVNLGGFSPDNAIGRLLCATKEEIINYLSKVLIYESNPGNGKTEYLGRAMIFGECNYDWNNAGTLTHHNRCLLDSTNKIYQKLTEIYTNDKIDYFVDNTHEMYYSGNNGTVKYPFNPSGDYPEPWMLFDSMETSGYCSWHGHGSPYGIAICNNKYNIASHSNLETSGRSDKRYGLECMRNTGSPNVVYSISCQNAPMDYLDSREFDSTGSLNWNALYDQCNLGRAMTTEYKHGAVATLMNSRDGYISSSNILEKSFLSLMDKRGLKIGNIENLSKLYNSHIKGSYFPHVRAAHYLIEDPEIEIWTSKPKDLAPFISVDSRAINVSLNDTIPTYLTISDISGEKTWEISKGAVYIPRPTNDYCISVWKSGFLPIIKMYAEAGTLISERKYIVNECTLGDVNNIGYTYSVEEAGLLSIKAKNKIDVHKGVIINKGGNISMDCAGTVYLHGGRVKAGGTLTVIAKDVKFGNDFTVEKGGILNIGIKTNN